MRKRRNHDAGFKARLALETVKGERTASELAAEYRAHLVDASAAYLGGKHRAKSSRPAPHGFVADVDAAFVQQILDVAQRRRESDVHHHRQTDDLGARLEILERAAFGHLTR